MATYAIGDVQGCYQELNDLLDRINFDSKNDRLWFTGDLINRGPESLEVLRMVKALDAVTVMGNHEAHLLAIDAGAGKPGKNDTLDAILNAPDRNELIQWITHFPLLHHDTDYDLTMVHAGLTPLWDLDQAIACAAELESVLRDETLINNFLMHMYGNQPHHWRDDLTGNGRLRFIINCFTRIRFCNESGHLDFDHKGPPGSQPQAYLPWFKLKNRKTRNNKIIFGHWASIDCGSVKAFDQDNVYPLDTGCVWGRKLTAMRLEDTNYFSVPSRQPLATQ